MNLAKSMAPDLLARNTLTTRTEELTSAVRNLETSLQSILLPSAHDSLEDSSQLYSAALQYMVWPLEALAVRRHVAPTPLTQRSTVIYNKHITDSSTHPQGITTIAEMEQQLRAALLHNSTMVDRIESLPSPHLWNVIAQLEKQSATLTNAVHMLYKDLDMVPSNSGTNDQSTESSSMEEQIRSVVQSQTAALIRIASRLSIVHDQVERLKNIHRSKLFSSCQTSHLIPSSSSSSSSSSRTTLLDSTNLRIPPKRSSSSPGMIGIGDGYNLKGNHGNALKGWTMVEDPFLAADMHEMEEERRIQEEIQRLIHLSSTMSSNNTRTTTTSASFSSTPNTVPLFQSSPTPTSTGGFMGSSTGIPNFTSPHGGMNPTTTTTPTIGMWGSSTSLGMSGNNTSGFHSTPTPGATTAVPQTPSQTTTASTGSFFSTTTPNATTALAPAPAAAGGVPLGGIFSTNPTIQPTFGATSISGDNASSLFGSATAPLNSMASMRRKSVSGGSSSLNKKKR